MLHPGMVSETDCDVTAIDASRIGFGAAVAEFNPLPSMWDIDHGANRVSVFAPMVRYRCGRRPNF